MATFYGDLMRNYNDSFSKGFLGGYPVILKFKTNPSDKISLGQSYRLSRNVAVEGETEVVSYTPTNVVTLKTSCSDKQVDSKFKFNNGAAVYEVGYKPKDLNKDGKKFNLKHNSKFEAASKEIASTETLKFGAKLFSDVNVGLNLDYSWNTSSRVDQVAKGAINFTKQEINFGLKTDYNITTKKQKSLLAQAAYNTAKVDHFFLLDVFKNQITYATLSLPAYKANETHACDIVVDINRKLVGFFGYPVTSSWAGIYRLNPSQTLRVKLGLANEWNLGFGWSQVVNSNLSVNFSHDLKLKQVWNGGKAGPGENP